MAHRPRPSAWVFLRRVPLVLGRLLLELVPVLAIAVTGHLFAASGLGGQTVSRLIILAVIDSYAVCEAILSVTRMLLSPGASRLRLFHLGDGTAAYLTRWTRRLVLIAVFGYAIGEVGLLLGLSDSSHDAAAEMRRAGAAHLPRGDRRAEAAGRAPLAARARRRHRPRLPPRAIAWRRSGTGSPCSCWPRSGWSMRWSCRMAILRCCTTSIVTALVLIGARITLLVLLGAVDRFMRPGPTSPSPFPGMEARLRGLPPGGVRHACG